MIMVGITTTTSSQTIPDTSSKYFVFSAGATTDTVTHSVFIFGQTIVGEFSSQTQSDTAQLGLLYLLKTGEIPPPSPDIVSDISPNPVSGEEVVIYLSNHTDDATATVSIFDAAGKTVAELSIKSMPFGEIPVKIPLHSFPAGTYYCRAVINGETGIKAFDVIR